MAAGRGVSRVVLVDEPTGWHAYFCTAPSATVADILTTVADRFSLDIDDTGTIFAGHHRPLRTWFLFLMGLNLSGLQISKELDLDRGDVREMIQLLRQGVVDRRPPVTFSSSVECDEVDLTA